MAKEYRVTAGVLAHAKTLGIQGEEAEAHLKKMARFAARFTHPNANYRFEQYIMHIEPDGLVTILGIMDCNEAAYYDRRTHNERKADESSGEATIEYQLNRR